MGGTDGVVVFPDALGAFEDDVDEDPAINLDTVNFEKKECTEDFN